MTIYEVIGDWLYDTNIVEQAKRRSDIEFKITNEAGPLIEHLVKVLKWDDPRSYRHHITDMDGWMWTIFRLKMKESMPKQRDYYKWMFTDHVGDVSDITEIVTELNRRYGSLPVIRSDGEIYTIIDKIIHQISIDFVARRRNSIEDYLP